MDERAAGPDDVPLVADTLARAFQEDPAWSWVFDDPARRPGQLRATWTLLLDAAVGHGWIRMTPGAGAVTQWVPPGVPEFTPDEEAALGRLMDELLDGDTRRSTALFERFDAARAGLPDHFYLSLFGTRPEQRGRGLGMALLAADLERIDGLGLPAYLESTNPANLDRYRSVGFVDRDDVTLPGGPTVTTMWRAARPAG